MGRNSYSPKSGITARPRILASLIALSFVLALAAKGAEPAVANKTKAAINDLTTLSLQDLYNLEIVQTDVLGAHTHPAGEWMFGYEYMFMNMEGIRDGSHGISPQDVFARGFTIAHLQMEMQEHMAQVMYAPTDWLTLMAMLPYKEMSMKHLSSSGLRFTQNASGIGDFEVMGIITVLGDIKKGGNRLLVNAGMSFPTGSTDVRDHDDGDPRLPLEKLEYPMQLGSGTFDLEPGLTYLGDFGHWTFGAQTIEKIRLGTNSSHYRFGNQYSFNAWGAYAVTDWFAPSLRVEGRIWEDIHGADPAYGPHPASGEATADLQAGERVDVLLGVNFFVPRGLLRGARFVVEGGVPIYERLDGPQLGLQWRLNLGVTYTF